MPCAALAFSQQSYREPAITESFSQTLSHPPSLAVNCTDGCKDLWNVNAIFKIVPTDFPALLLILTTSSGDSVKINGSLFYLVRTAEGERGELGEGGGERAGTKEMFHTRTHRKTGEGGLQWIFPSLWIQIGSIKKNISIYIIKNATYHQTLRLSNSK